MTDGPSRARRRMRRLAVGAVATVSALVLAACGSTGDRKDVSTTHDDVHSSATATPRDTPQPDSGPERTGVRHRPLRPGEHNVTVRMPSPYTPSAPYGAGTDDYRCFLLDPGIASDQYITGFDVRPGNREVVHHVILFRVPPDLVHEAQTKDARTPGEGWTCFGNSGLSGGQSIDDAPWVGAWAPGSREQVYGKGFGEQVDRGSRVIMQVHYNLLGGTGPDRSAAELRLAPATNAITPLVTQLLPAPVELPCRPQYAHGALCSRSAAVADVKKRFGVDAGSTADALHLLCGTDPPGPTQTCTRTVTSPETVRGVAGHMHLLGTSIKVEVNPRTSRARTLLDIRTWDFDDQRSRPVRPAHLEPGDTVQVSCTHSQALRDRLPAFAGQPDRYVVWGEGSTDEMCLGILLVTRP